MSCSPGKDSAWRDSWRSSRLGGECETTLSPPRRQGRKENAKEIRLAAAMLLRTTKPKMFVLLERIVSGFSWDRTLPACTRFRECTQDACGPRKPRYRSAFSAVNFLVAA